jgi:hypothetical protein
MTGSTGVSSTPRPLVSISDASEYWIARSSAQLRTAGHDGEEHGTAFSRRNARPSYGRNVVPPKDRGRRESRVPNAPAASRGNKKPHELVTTGSPESSRLSPRNGFTAYFVLSPVTGLFCHRRRRIISADLTPASGRQDHTILPSAPVSPVLRHHSRPLHPLPNVRDDRETPLLRARDIWLLDLICPSEKRKYFCKGGLTSDFRGCPLICPTGKSVMRPRFAYYKCSTIEQICSRYLICF